MNLRVSACDEELLAKVVRAVDDEFVYSKGRSLSLASRFPGAFTNENLRRIHVAQLDGGLVGAAVARGFDYVTESRRWRGAMIGAVWTHPDQRGKGIASAVLQSMRDAEAREGTEFQVLWTSAHSFYERLGWQNAGRGIFATLDPAAASAPQVASRSITDVAVDALDAVRSRVLRWGTVRQPSVWASIPIPATRVEFFVHENSYAVTGVGGQTTFVYELVGNEAHFDGIWQSIRAGGRRVLINDEVGSHSADWLARHGVAFYPQSHAMWMPLVDEAAALAERLFIPYLDRI